MGGVALLFAPWRMTGSASAALDVYFLAFNNGRGGLGERVGRGGALTRPLADGGKRLRSAGRFLPDF